MLSSVGHWKGVEAHSELADLLLKKKEAAGLLALDEFIEKGALGDFIFTPIGPQEFIELDSFRIMSLLDNPSSLSSWIARGTSVLTIVGPCQRCRQPKSEVLRCLLELPPSQRLHTHLVIDHRAARDL